MAENGTNGNGRRWVGQRLVEALVIAAVTAGTSTFATVRVMEAQAASRDKLLDQFRERQERLLDKVGALTSDFAAARAEMRGVAERASRRDQAVERLSDHLLEVRNRLRVLEIGRGGK